MTLRDDIEKLEKLNATGCNPAGVKIMGLAIIRAQSDMMERMAEDLADLIATRKPEPYHAEHCKCGLCKARANLKSYRAAMGI